ncbi:MAG: 30S ribosomal protein S20 [Catonella sp.]|uniref:30S ribosomal protein S20 n=1 Tax=Catonella sp. TaxID=2382125 RepID=UPI003FA16CC7
MANIKSAKKRIKVAAKKTLRNKMITSKVKTLVKKVVSAVAVSDNEAAKVALIPAVAAIDKAANKGVYHRKTASRKISRLTKSVNKLA